MFASKVLLSEDLADDTVADAFMQGRNPSPEFAHLLREALRAEERDRRLMALDIHDGLLQYVIGALYQLEQGPWTLERPAAVASTPGEAGVPVNNGAAEPKLGQFTATDLEQLNNARALLRKAIGEGRRLIGGLRPPILEDRGLLAALHDLIEERNGPGAPTIELDGQKNGARYSALTEGMLFRIAQEGLNNARQHSQSTRIAVRLAEHGDWLRLEIQDWGIGFDPEIVRDSAAGLSGIRERVRWMGGNCEISTAPGLGTILTVDLPISPSSQRSSTK
jgi:signal transduction histidine kinase